MNKKIISLVLALVMVLGTFTSVFAAETTEKKAEAKKAEAGEKVEKVVGKENKIQYIIDKKFVEGYEDGSYGYDKNIKRSEITRLLVIANGNEDLAKKLQGSMQVYSDVNTAHWANGVITVGTTRPSDANGIAMLAGYPDGSFKPERDVTYAELAKMLVVLVKKDLTPEMVKNAVWASSWMTWAAELGILDDVTVADSNKAANRADAFTMMYNALYKMQEFKRVPANEKIGVLSSLNKDKLVLNQDAKEQEYTITADTVFVNTYEKDRTNVIKVKNITNPDYYLGSLVRIMTNDKKEVTHILELGNPKDMALGRPAGTAGDNSRWNGVADATVSTKWSDVNTLNSTMKTVLDSWAKIEFKDNRNGVKGITFQTPSNKEVKYVRVNSDTKVYVANPYNNIMREVKDINEAMSLLGYAPERWDMIPNVYAGYDTDGHTSAIKRFDATDRNTAKVVVFNVVAKSEDGDLYRVVNQSSSLGKATLEDTDGKLYDRDFFKNMSAFPYNYGDLYDVIEVNPRAAAGTDTIDKRIDHSDTVKYPIVEVIGLYNDGKSLELKDEYKYRTVIDTRDADIFNAKQFKDLRVGDKVQFETKDKSTVIDILSILPRDTKVEGSMRNVVKSIYGGTAVGKLMKVNESGNFSTIYVEVYNNTFNTKDNLGRQTFYVTEDNAKMLKSYTEKEIVFDVTDNMNGFYGKMYADNFRLNDGKENPIKPKAPATGKVEDVKAAIRDLDAKYPDQDSVNKDFEAAKKAVENIDKMIEDLKFEDKTEWKEAGATYEEALDRVKNLVTTRENAIKTEYGQQITEVKNAAEGKVNDVKVAKDTISAKTAVEKVKAIVDAELENGVTAKYEATKVDKDANTATVKVTFEKAPADAQTLEVNVTEEA